jgi:hypothetical protein
LEWKGVFNHWDSYPTALGKDVWRFASDEKNLGLLCESILRAGRWEAFLGQMEPTDDHITSENPNPLFIEWVYIIDPDHNMLHVMRHQSVGEEDWSKPRIYPPQKRPDRVVDYGRFCYKHVLVASLDLDEPEPDWAKLQMDGQDEED